MKPHTPIFHLIVDALKRKGTLSDSELLKALKENNEGLTMEDLYDALMRLEVRGLVYVSGTTRSGKTVSLTGAELGSGSKGSTK